MAYPVDPCPAHWGTDKHTLPALPYNLLCSGLLCRPPCPMGPRRTHRQPNAGISFGTPAAIAASSVVEALAAATAAADGIADANSAGGAPPAAAAAAPAGGDGLPVDLLQGQPSALVLPENVNWSQLLTDVSARLPVRVPLPYCPWRARQRCCAAATAHALWLLLLLCAGGLTGSLQQQPGTLTLLSLLPPHRFMCSWALESLTCRCRP